MDFWYPSAVRVHNLAVKFPIVIDNPKLSAGKVNALRNWMERYFKVSVLNATVKKTTKHIIVYLREFRMPARSDFFLSLALHLAKIFVALYFELSRKYRIVIDLEGAEIIRQHIANKASIFREVLPSRRNHVTEFLGRSAISVLGREMEQDAWVKLDFSRGEPEVETNDLLYEEKLLLMPEIVWELARSFKNSLKVFERWEEALKSIRKLLEGVRHG